MTTNEQALRAENATLKAELEEQRNKQLEELRKKKAVSASPKRPDGAPPCWALPAKRQPAALSGGGDTKRARPQPPAMSPPLEPPPLSCTPRRRPCRHRHRSSGLHPPPRPLPRWSSICNMFYGISLSQAT